MGRISLDTVGRREHVAAFHAVELGDEVGGKKAFCLRVGVSAEIDGARLTQHGIDQHRA